MTPRLLAFAGSGSGSSPEGNHAFCVRSDSGRPTRSTTRAPRGILGRGTQGLGPPGGTGLGFTSPDAGSSSRGLVAVGLAWGFGSGIRLRDSAQGFGSGIWLRDLALQGGLRSARLLAGATPRWPRTLDTRWFLSDQDRGSESVLFFVTRAHAFGIVTAPATCTATGAADASCECPPRICLDYSGLLTGFISPVSLVDVAASSWDSRVASSLYVPRQLGVADGLRLACQLVDVAASSLGSRVASSLYVPRQLGVADGLHLACQLVDVAASSGGIRVAPRSIFAFSCIRCGRRPAR